MIEDIFTPIPKNIINVPSKIRYMDKILESLNKAHDNTLSKKELETLVNTIPNRKLFEKVTNGNVFETSDADINLVTNDKFLLSVLQYFRNQGYVENYDGKFRLTAEGGLKFLFGGFSQQYKETVSDRFAKIVLWIIAILGFILSLINTICSIK